MCRCLWGGPRGEGGRISYSWVENRPDQNTAEKMAKLTPVNWLLAMIAMLAGAEAATGERLCVQTIVNARKFDASPSKFAGGTGVVCFSWGGGVTTSLGCGHRNA